MKSTIITILLLAAMQGFGQFQGNISGTVTQDPVGTPVPDQPVFIIIMIDGDSLNIITDNVLTNASGIYSFSFSMTGSFARVDISTPDCNGTMLTASGYITDSLQSIVRDFIICTATGCQAQFTYYPDSVQQGYSYQFIDLSSGNITGWLWDFGDGSYSQEEDPVHIFPLDGQYEVCLSVSGPDCQSTWCEMVDVNPMGDCYNYFTYQVYGLPVSFTGNHYPLVPSDYIWDFGDGGSGTGQYVDHSYSADGVYYVTLYSTDSTGCSASSSQAVVVGDTILFNQVYGQVFEGNFPMTSGFVILSSLQNNPAFTPYMDQAPVDTSGVFIFPYVPYGQYLLYAVPQDGSNYLPTYFGDVQHWPEAVAFSALGSGMLYNINLSTTQSFPSPGQGTITGYISETSGRGDILGMAQVILYNADFASLGFTSVTPNGSFSFAGLANGLYYILPELPGISSNLMAVEISDLTLSCNVYINFDGTSFLGLEEEGIMDRTLRIVPNPASDHALVSVAASRQEQVKINVTDLSGRTCFSGIYQVNPGENSIALPIQQLQPGIYLINLSSSSGKIRSIKFVKI